MIEDSDIWRAANLLIDRHCEDATLPAQRADELLEKPTAKFDGLA